MQSLNVRFIAICSFSILVVASATHLLHGYQVGRNAGVFLREAQRAELDGRMPAMIDYLDRYVLLAPGETEPLAKLALALADLRIHGRAFMLLEQVLRREPERGDVRRQLVESAMALGRFQDAREHLEEHLLKHSTTDGSLWDLLGQCQQAAGDDELAAGSFQQAVKHVPDQLPTYARLTDLVRRRLERPDEADQVMDEMVAANDANYQAYVLRGQYLRTHGRPEKAADDSAKSLELAPEDADVLLLAAACAADGEQFQQGRELAERGLELFPKLPRMYLTLCDIELRSSGPSAAMAVLDRGLVVLPNDKVLLWNMADLLIGAGKTDKAQEIIERLSTEDQPAATLSFLEGRMLLAQGQWFDASRKLEACRAELFEWANLAKQADYMLGQCYEPLGKTDLQLAAYRRAISADPLWVQGRLGLGSALLSLGRIDESLAEYQQVVRLRGAPALGWTQLARLMILQNLRRPETRRDWQEVEKILDRVAEVTPESSHLPILRAELLVGKRETGTAEKLLLEARDRQPESLQLWTALVALAQRDGQWTLAAERLDEMEEQQGDSVPLRLARGRHRIENPDSPAEIALDDLAASAEGFTEEQRLGLHRGLAGMALQIGDFELARRLCRKVADENPHDLRIRLLLFDLALRTSDQEAMRRLLGEVRQIEGAGPLFSYGEAVRLVIVARDGPTGGLDDARRYLVEAGLARPRWSRVPLLLAEIDQLQGQAEASLEHYLKAIELGERNPRVLRRVLQLLYGMRRYREADEVVGRLEQQQAPVTEDLARVVSQISLQVEDFGRALSLAQRVAETSDDYRDHMWLGHVLRVLGRDAEAEAALRRAVELSVESPEAWVALVQFFAHTKQTDKAEKVLALAEQRLDAAGEAALAMAQCYEAIGCSEQAEARYRAAESAAPHDFVVARRVADFFLRTGRPIEAEPLLSRIVAGARQAEKADVVWARRNLALALATQGDYRGFQEAKRLVEQNLKEDPVSRQDRRAKAVMLSTQSRRGPRGEAIGTLEQLVSDTTDPSPEDRFLLAQLYLADGNWSKASRLLWQLLGANPQDVRYLSTYARALLARKEVHEAEPWVARLEELAPQHFATVVLRAELHFARDETSEAVALLKQFANGDASQPPDRSSRLRLVALQFESLARSINAAANADAESLLVSEAEAMFRQYVSSQTDQRLVLAGYLARRGQTEQAFEAAGEAWQTAPPSEVAVTCVELLRSGQSDDAQRQQVDEILQAALAKHAQSLPLQVVLADLRMAQDRYDEAEVIYREILEKDGRHLVALNNVAMLAALRGQNVHEALKFVNQAIDLAGPTANLLDTRAGVLRVLGKADQAVADMNDAIAEAPTASRYFHLALAAHAAGDHAAARAALGEAHNRGLTAERLHALERPDYRKLAGHR